MNDKKHPHHHEHHTRQHKHEELPAAGNYSEPEPHEPQPPEIHNDSQQTPEKSEQKWFRNPDWYMVAVTVLILVVGAWTAVIFHGQWTEMANQTKLLNEQAKQAALDSIEAAKKVERQLDITERQANAAQASVKAIQRQMRLDQRPWLKFEIGGQVINDKNPNDIIKSVTFAEGQVPRVPVRLVNVGKTAARGVHGIIVLEIVPLGKDPNLPQRKKKYLFLAGGPIPTRPKAPVRAATPIKGGDIFPGMYSEVPIDRVHIRSNGRAVEGFPLGHQEALSLLSDKAYLSFYGEFFYSDIFGVKHWTRFCSMYTVNGTPVDSEKCADFSDVDTN